MASKIITVPYPMNRDFEGTVVVKIENEKTVFVSKDNVNEEFDKIERLRGLERRNALRKLCSSLYELTINTKRQVVIPAKIPRRQKTPQISK